jgi:hypothetical protein
MSHVDRSSHNAGDHPVGLALFATPAVVAVAVSCGFALRGFLL